MQKQDIAGDIKHQFDRNVSIINRSYDNTYSAIHFLVIVGNLNR